MLRGGFLHTTSERGEGYIAYKRPKEKLGFKTLWPIVTGMLHNSSMKRLMRFAIAIKKGGKSLQERMDKEKKPYIFVGMVCVCEKYQGQGYMRKVMDIAFAEGENVLRAAVTVQAQNPGLNPQLLEKAIARYLPELTPDFVRVRRRQLLDADGQVFR